MTFATQDGEFKRVCVMLYAKSFDHYEVGSYSASHQDPSCLTLSQLFYQIPSKIVKISLT